MGFVFFLFLTPLTLVSGDCNTLPQVDNTINNATGTGPYTEGTVVNFVCDQGYTARAGGNTSYLCSSGKWVQGQLQCNPTRCQIIETPENGQITNTPSWEAGTSIYFECNEGYDRDGPSSLVCRVNGQWDPSSPPNCSIRVCPEFGSIQHGETSQDAGKGITKNEYGSVVKVTCDNGYVIVGSPNVKCKADGTWATKPTCEKVSCPPYPGLNSSCIDRTLFALSMLFIQCRQDVSVTRTGADSVECSNGKWEETGIIACYCDCKIDADMDFVSLENLNPKGYLNHSDTLSWSCKDATIKNTKEKLTCVDGRIGVPKCKKINPSTAKPTESISLTTNGQNTHGLTKQATVTEPTEHITRSTNGQNTQGMTKQSNINNKQSHSDEDTADDSGVFDHNGAVNLSGYLWSLFVLSVWLL